MSQDKYVPSPTRRRQLAELKRLRRKAYAAYLRQAQERHDPFVLAFDSCPFSMDELNAHKRGANQEMLDERQ